MVAMVTDVVLLYMLCTWSDWRVVVLPPTGALPGAAGLQAPAAPDNRPYGNPGDRGGNVCGLQASLHATGDTCEHLTLVWCWSCRVNSTPDICWSYTEYIKYGCRKIVLIFLFWVSNKVEEDVIFFGLYNFVNEMWQEVFRSYSVVPSVKHWFIFI